jgi:hypothetical protein
VHVAPTCVGSGEGSDHFESYVVIYVQSFPAFLQYTAFPCISAIQSLAEMQEKTVHNYIRPKVVRPFPDLAQVGATCTGLLFL